MTVKAAATDRQATILIDMDFVRVGRGLALLTTVVPPGGVALNADTGNTAAAQRMATATMS